MQAKVDNGRVDEIAFERYLKVPKRKVEYIDELKVEVKTFEFLRAKYKIGEVNVLQMDVEGL